ncbi:hypothetical protein B0H12DRAFT_1077691 [Mycena haematopus]|nr:hypothetical protein B0H12DRAFT_1077691 [Mycena haematopus]
MQNEIADIEKLFYMIQRLPGGHRYDEDYFKQRLQAASQLAEYEQKAKDALIACYEEQQDLDKLPKVVRSAIDSVLCEVATRMEDWDCSTLPYGAADTTMDDDDESDAAIFSRLRGTYPVRPIGYFKHHPPTATKRFLYVFIYVAANEDALLQKWRLDDAERLEVKAYRRPPNCSSWADFEVFAVDTSEYGLVGQDINMIGRGRILIFRRIGLAKTDCPSLDRRERWAVASAKDTGIENSYPSDASSPLPPSSPPNWSDCDEEGTISTAAVVESVGPMPQAGLPRVSNSLKRKSGLQEDEVVAKKRQLARPDTTNAGLEEDTVGAGSSKLAHPGADTTLADEEAPAGHVQPPIYVSTSDPDFVPSDSDDSSDVEIVDSRGPLFNAVV